MIRLVRLALTPGLTFFVCLISCNPKTKNKEIHIRWKNDQAISIVIPASLIKGIPDDSASATVAVSLAGQLNPVAIFGAYTREGGGFVFSPLIPFTRGMRYEVRVRGNLTGNFEIPEDNTGHAPSVTAIYPSADTLPENLLKVYLHFDRPMREGLSGKYVKLIKNRRDTVDGAFLDLQPELWNPERTLLTVWLDPGRIKRDLQPNKRLGAPMQSGMHYEVFVSQAWTDTRGKELAKSYRKAFVTTAKDSRSPQPATWILVLPSSSTRQPLQIHFKEPLDHGLLQEVFTIHDSKGTNVAGQWHVGSAEMQAGFTPTVSWKAGSYKILIEPRLEDLAGNNLVRPFDKDVTKEQEPVTGEITVLPFDIK